MPFGSVKVRHSFCQYRVFLVKNRRMNYNLTRGQAEKLTSGLGHDLVGKGHVAYKSNRIVRQNTSKVLSLL